MMKPFEGKKLLFLGGNTETVPLVKTANNLGAVTVVSSSNPESMAKACAAVKYDTDATDIAAMVALARQEQVAGVLPGTDDIFIPAYCKVCDVLGLPCYANEEIIEVFGYKDTFKATCERYGIHGVHTKRQGIPRLCNGSVYCTYFRKRGSACYFLHVSFQIHQCH